MFLSTTDDSRDTTLPPPFSPPPPPENNIPCRQQHGKPSAAAQKEDDENDYSRLTPRQIRALFDILTHYETYAEFEGVSAARAAPDVGIFGPRAGGGNDSHGDSGGSSGASSVKSFDTAQTSASALAPQSDDSSNITSDDDPPAPIIRLLHRDLVSTFPGLSNLAQGFWDERILGIVARWRVTASYDKGVLGLRSTLATLAATVVAALARGRLGGLDRESRENRDREDKADKEDRGDKEDGKDRKDRKWDIGNAEHLRAAWHEVREGIVYGNLVDEITDALVTTENIEEHSPALGLAIEYCCIHIATLLHRVYVVCPEGQLLLQLLQHAHSLTPYGLIKQVFRLSSPSAVVAAVTRLLLAKMGIAALSSWAGLTSSGDDGGGGGGVNLLQRIVTTVLAWDAKGFRRAAERAERAAKNVSSSASSSSSPPADLLLGLVKTHALGDRAEHDRIRVISIASQESIVVSILRTANPSFDPASLPQDLHALLLTYLSNLLSVRDRTTITDALARTAPDLLSGAVRDLVAALDPLLRALHQGLDLRAYIEDSQAFIDEFLACARVDEGRPAPTVADFAALLRRNRACWFRWVGRAAVGCPDLREGVRAWAKTAARLFRVGGEEGEMLSVRAQVEGLWRGLEAGVRRELGPVLDAHAEYLAAGDEASLRRLQVVIDASRPRPADPSTSSTMKLPKKRFALGRISPSPSRSASASPAPSGPPPPSPPPQPQPQSLSPMFGPGVFLTKAQSLLDDTPLSPATPTGRVRRGREVLDGDGDGGGGVRGAGDGALAGRVRVEVPRDEGLEGRRVGVGGVARAFERGFVRVLEGFVGR